MGNYLRFGWIITCFFISVSYGTKVFDPKDALLLRLALLLTVMADFCLLITGNKLAGVLFFCIVQLIYHVRYRGFRPTKKLLFILPAVFFFTKIILQLDTLIAVASVYATCFLFSLLGVWEAWKAKKYAFSNSVLIITGMLLFMLCDIHVALFNIDLNITAPQYQLILFLIWLFYAPSQFLLALSGRHFGIVSASSSSD